VLGTISSTLLYTAVQALRLTDALLTKVFRSLEVKRTLHFIIRTKNTGMDFDVLLTVHLSIILVINQLNARILVL